MYILESVAALKNRMFHECSRNRFDNVLANIRTDAHSDRFRFGACCGQVARHFQRDIHLSFAVHSAAARRIHNRRCHYYCTDNSVRGTNRANQNNMFRSLALFLTLCRFLVPGFASPQKGPLLLLIVFEGHIQTSSTA